MLQKRHGSYVAQPSLLFTPNCRHVRQSIRLNLIAPAAARLVDQRWASRAWIDCANGLSGAREFGQLVHGTVTQCVYSTVSALGMNGPPRLTGTR